MYHASAWERRHSIPGYSSGWGWVPLILFQPQQSRLKFQKQQGIVTFGGLLLIFREEGLYYPGRDGRRLSRNPVTSQQFCSRNLSFGERRAFRIGKHVSLRGLVAIGRKAEKGRQSSRVSDTARGDCRLILYGERFL